jgi:uncharacterized coiled-coil DUF342 family protein
MSEVILQAMEKLHQETIELTHSRDGYMERLGVVRQILCDALPGANEQTAELARMLQHERDNLHCEVVEQSRLLEASGEREANLLERVECLERELVEANECVDELAAGYPDGMLPKDIEALLCAKYDLTHEIDGLREQRDVIMGRLSETHTRMLDTERQRDTLAVICGELIAAVRVNSMRDTFREATHNQIEEWLKQWVDRLAAVKGVKGGNDE